MFRFANLVERSGNMGSIWSAVRSIRFKTLTSQFRCGENHLLNNQVSQVKAVEQYLKIESSDLKFENMTNGKLKIAAQTFIYLALCPGKYNAWTEFYKNIFKAQSPSQILLTLNRIIKETKPLESGFFKQTAFKHIKITHF